MKAEETELLEEFTPEQIAKLDSEAWPGLLDPERPSGPWVAAAAAFERASSG